MIPKNHSMILSRYFKKTDKYDFNSPVCTVSVILCTSSCDRMLYFGSSVFTDLQNLSASTTEISLKFLAVYSAIHLVISWAVELFGGIRPPNTSFRVLWPQVQCISLCFSAIVSLDTIMCTHLKYSEGDPSCWPVGMEPSALQQHCNTSKTNAVVDWVGRSMTFNCKITMWFFFFIRIYHWPYHMATTSMLYNIFS